MGAHEQLSRSRQTTWSRMTVPSASSNSRRDGFICQQLSDICFLMRIVRMCPLEFCLAVVCCPCCCLTARCWEYPIQQEPPPPTKPLPIAIALDKLPVCEYVPRTPTGPTDQCDDECSICLATLEPGDIVRRFKCTHCFHKECIDRWLIQKARCPLCNGNLCVPQAMLASPPSTQSMVREA